MEEAAAERLLRKIRRFVQEDLDPEERELFASLLAPGVALAYEDPPDVAGFDSTRWRPNRLPEALREEVRRSGVRVVGLED